MNPLTIFPKHPSAPDTYYIGGGWSPACITAVDKRFSPGELAAEYWRASEDNAYIMEGIVWPGMCDGWRTDEDDAQARLNTLHHFCTQPAHDESDTIK